MKEEEKSLVLSFGNSLTEEVSGITSEYVELGLDALMDDGLFKDIPIISTAVAVYRIGKSVREKHHIAKLISFLNEINKGIANEEKRQNYRKKFASNEKFRNQELEYILILIDRYISFDKPQMLAKLYLAYLDGDIVWEEFTMYAEVIDRFLLLDCRTLVSEATTFHTLRDGSADIILRLVALGLMVEDNSITISEARKVIKGESKSASKMSSDSKKKKYRRTDFGRRLADILR